MKAIYKYSVIAIVLSGSAFLFFSYRDDGNNIAIELKPTKDEVATRARQTDVTSKHNGKLNFNSSFDMGLYQGVVGLQVEIAMAEKKLPRLPPVLNNPSDPLPPMKRILLVSTWRTGSSFLGELIASLPGVFYSYEPLHFISEKERISAGVKAVQSMELLNSIFRCQFPQNYLTHINGGRNQNTLFMLKNRRTWDACQHDRSLCSRPEFVQRLCTHFPIQLIKTVRLELESCEQFVQEPAFQPLKIVFLVRDPRAIMASRANLTWCDHPSCKQSNILCQHMADDVIQFQKFKTKYPNHFYLIKFEDLSQNPEKETEKLLSFLELRETLHVTVFLRTHTNSTSTNLDPYSTVRNSKTKSQEWRTKLTANLITQISNDCISVLKLLNYPLK